MRIGGGHSARQTYSVHQLRHAGGYFAARADIVYQQGRGDQFLYAHAAIQRRVRVLKDHLHLFAGGLQLALAAGGNVFPFAEDLALRDVIQTEDGFPKCTFSAAGLAHDAESFTLCDGQTDIIHRMKGAFRRFEILFQMPCFNKCRVIHGAISFLQLTLVQRLTSRQEPGRSAAPCPETESI